MEASRLSTHREKLTSYVVSVLLHSNYSKFGVITVLHSYCSTL